MVVGFLVFFTSKKTAVYRLYFFHIDLMAQKRGLRHEKRVKIRWLSKKIECFIDGQNHTVPFTLGFWDIVTDESVRFTLITL